MTHRTPRILLALVVALLATSSLMMPVSAGPAIAGPGPLLNTSKAQEKAEAEAMKAAAEAEKELKKCTAKGTLPCSPTVTVTFVPFHLHLCGALVTVQGFAPGNYRVEGTFEPLAFEDLEVDESGTGSATITGAFAPSTTYTIVVNGISVTSAPDSCPI